jgi:hypothetical protein
MEIQLNTTNIDPIGRIGPSQPVKGETKTQEPGAKFDKSEALNQALRQLPDSRAELVTRAKEKASLSGYPPPETIRKFSALLALNIGD